MPGERESVGTIVKGGQQILELFWHDPRGSKIPYLGQLRTLSMATRTRVYSDPPPRYGSGEGKICGRYCSWGLGTGAAGLLDPPRKVQGLFTVFSVPAALLCQTRVLSHCCCPELLLLCEVCEEGLKRGPKSEEARGRT